MCEYEIRLSSFDAEISAALLAYELAFDTGDRREILRAWAHHRALQQSKTLFIDDAVKEASAA